MEDNLKTEEYLIANNKNINDIFKNTYNYQVLDIINPSSLNIPVKNNTTVDELIKLNESNNSLKIIIEQYLNELKISNSNNKELQNIVISLKNDLESERIEKSKVDKKLKKFERIFIILGFLVALVGTIAAIMAVL